MHNRLLSSLILPLILVLFVISISGCQGASAVPTTELPSEITPVPTITEEDPYQEARESMVREQIAARGVEDEEVLNALRNVPRHEFVPEKYLNQAYADHPLPIGHGQTISQPYIVGLMSEELNVESGDRVLEVGTGSGYQAAVLAEMGMEVYTVEIIPELASQAEDRLARLGYDNVHVQNADGYFGWEEHGPYDAIIVTAAPDHLPQPLVQQLRDGGHLVIPIGPIGAVQTLWRYEKVAGEIQATNLGSVKFVPLTGEH